MFGFGLVARDQRGPNVLQNRDRGSLQCHKVNVKIAKVVTASEGGGFGHSWWTRSVLIVRG